MDGFIIFIIVLFGYFAIAGLIAGVLTSVGFTDSDIGIFIGLLWPVAIISLPLIGTMALSYGLVMHLKK